MGAIGSIGIGRVVEGYSDAITDVVRCDCREGCGDGQVDPVVQPGWCQEEERECNFGYSDAADQVHEWYGWIRALRNHLLPVDCDGNLFVLGILVGNCQKYGIVEHVRLCHVVGGQVAQLPVNAVVQEVDNLSIGSIGG